MATMTLARTPEEIKKFGIAQMRDSYNKLANDYNKLINREYLICPVCGNVKRADTNYYTDRRYVASKFPICKECLQMMAENRKSPSDKPNETKEITILLHLMARRSALWIGQKKPVFHMEH